MQFLETCNGVDIFRLKNVVKNVPQLENAHIGTTWKCSGNPTRFIDRVHRGSWLSIRDVMFVKKTIYCMLWKCPTWTKRNLIF